MIHHNHIFNHFPLDKRLYSSDIAAIMPETIERYGESEWRYTALACELHGHIGLYTMLGVKMGLWARELLGAEQGSLHIISYAGSTPPISCLNDGLQVATEATLGHGLIEVTHPHIPCAEAEFFSSEGRLRLRLKPDREDLMIRELQAAVARYGSTKGYWDKVRELAIGYWLEWNRKDIFDVVRE